MTSKIFGIDFGTDSIKIYRKGVGVIYEQKAYIATKNKNTVIAIGNQAYEMDGKVPEDISVVNPLRNGVIASVDRMLSLLNCVFLDLSREFGKIKGGKYFIAVPSDITDVEKRSFYDLVDSTFIRPKKIILVDKPVADAIGAGVDIENSTGALIVNIGADTTEISVISLGGIVLSKLVPIGGKKFDEAIISSVRRKFNLIIGSKTAESCKKKIASFDEDIKTCRIYGRDVISGLPRERTVSSDMIVDALKEQIQAIIENIRTILERTPPEISSDIYEKGIYITGGSSKISGLKKYIEDSLNLKVHLTADGQDSVINGLAEIMENDRYESDKAAI